MPKISFRRISKNNLVPILQLDVKPEQKDNEIGDELIMLLEL
ncbi:MAG: hypothetical protein ACFE9C_13820 [Candidatus Hodarchaeota archaeon]